MKRDKELQRLLLIAVRDGKEPQELRRYPETEQVYNSALLIEDEMVDGEAIRGANGEYVSTMMRQLTSKGHNYLDSLEKSASRKEKHGDSEPFHENSPQDATSGKKSKISKSEERVDVRLQIGVRTSFSKTATGDEITLGVEGYANVLAKLLKASDEKELCLAIFGPWGRGKTFLMEQTIKKLNEQGADKQSFYETVQFSAWKYPSRPEVWIHLYEAFFCKIAQKGWLRSAAFTILAGIQRHGISKLWIAWLALMLTAVPKMEALERVLTYLRQLEFTVAAAVMFFFFIFIWEFWNTSSHLRRHYFSGARHFEKLGLQATIGLDLKALLRGWVRVDFKNARFWFGLIQLWGATVALIWLICLRCHGANDVAWFISSLVAIPTLFISMAFLLSAKSPTKVLLVVDDLDRCQFDHLLTIVESIKLLLEDSEICSRIQVIMLVEEDILKHAIWGKYKQLAEEDIQKVLGTKVAPRRIIRDNIEKLFTAHLRLSTLKPSDIADVVRSFGGKLEPLESESDPNVSKTFPLIKDISDAVAKPRFDSDALLSRDEKNILLSEISKIYGQQQIELGPRALRAIMFRYQLARLILEELRENYWNPELLAKMIIQGHFSGSVDFSTVPRVDEKLRTVAEQVA